MQLAQVPPFRLGELEVRPAERTIVFAGGREILEPRVMEVLVTLAKADGRVVGRDELVDACWGGRAVTDDAVNRAVSRVRRVSELHDGPTFTLETIAKVGYRLVLAEAAQAAEAASLSVEPVSAPQAERHALLLGLALAAIAAVMVAFAAFILEPRHTPPARPDLGPLTLAVLPFDGVSKSDNTEFLAKSLPLEIRSRLSRMRGLRVIAETSSFAVAAEQLSRQEMGRRLGADILLGGSVRVEGEITRITVELVDAPSATVAWTTDYNGDVSNLMAAEDAITVAVLEHLARELGDERVQIVTPRKAVDAEVHRLLMDARQCIMKRLSRTFAADQAAAEALADRVEQDLNDVLAREPENADALVLRAFLVARGGISTSSAQRKTIFERQMESKELVNRALRSDPDNPAALTALAEYQRRFAWQWKDSERLFRRALAIDPNNPDTHTWFSYYLMLVGRCTEAVEQANLAQLLDPVSPWRQLVMPRALKCQGSMAEADQLYRKALDASRDNAFLIREIYLNFLVRRDGSALRALARHVRDDLWQGAPSAPVAAEILRMEAGAAALDGDPEALFAVIGADEDQLSEYMTGQAPTTLGRFTPDVYWTLSLEAAIAGRPGYAAELYGRAIAGRSLYISETMPFGTYEFTPETRADPRYQAIWRADPALSELAALRLQALREGKMAGILPDGRSTQAASVSAGGEQ
ncbi:MAG: winged helix-turn-helix domain-containing protein [Alphaproteobacteria bacterium]|nr:winged helix-turn-helix domain-containing protein [Alphaproteobacteria bacterium]